MLIGRQTARAILIDEHNRLLLIKRTRPGQAAYWTTPGGGVEDTDVSVEAALRRELLEELGAEVAEVTPAFSLNSKTDNGTTVQHFFVARLVKLDESARTGPEFADQSRGGYEVEWVDLTKNQLTAIDLKPTALKEFVLRRFRETQP